MTSTVVFGLDGGNWGLIEDWLEGGELPNIAALRERGTHAVSKSEYPPVTCPNWKCYATSKNPGELGVFWWERISMADQTITFPDSTSFESAEIWDYLADAGFSWLCLNMPTMYPTRDIPNGDVVAGGPLCGSTGYTSDPSLQEFLESEFDYQVLPDRSLTSTEDSDREVEIYLDMMETRFDVLEWYLDEHDPDFAHVTLFLLNVLQHYFWDENPVFEAWKLVDRRIGDIIEDEMNVVLMSDHGSGPVDTVFHINQWLANEDYISTAANISTVFERLNITKERVTSVAEALGIRQLAKRAPSSIKNLFPQEGEGAKREAKSSLVNWPETEALASGQGPVYVSDSITDSRRETLVRELNELEARNGREVARDVYPKSEVYAGKNFDVAPDLVIDMGEGMHISDGLGHQSVFTEPSRWNAENNRDGLFLAAGPDFDDGKLDDISIKDISPTLLHLLDIPIPEDMEGRVLDVFTEKPVDNVPTQAPLSVDAWSDDHSDTVEDRLEDLGYIGQ